MSIQLSSMTSLTSVEYMISFVDLSRFTADSRGRDDTALAKTMNLFYEIIDDAVEKAGGTVIKYMGDSALIVFPVEFADVGTETLLELKTQVDMWMAEIGFRSRLDVKIHCGEVVVGPYGGRGKKRLDVIGNAVNLTVTLACDGVSLSPQAFRKLSPECRKRFQKHTPPIVYILKGSPRPRGR